MGLSTLQLNEISLEYERRRSKMRELQDERLNRIFQAIPQLPEIRKEMISLLTRLALGRSGSAASDIEDIRSRLEDLKALEAGLLSEHGFSKKDLDPEYVCEDCRDTGYRENRKCHCYKQLEIQLLYKNSNLQHCLDDENFSTFSMEYYTDKPSRDLASRALDKSKAFARDVMHKEKDGIHNILIYGSVGTGKTFLTHCIAKELLDRGVVVLYFSAIRLFDVISQITFSREKDGEYALDDLYDADVLIIDDLGTEMVNDFVRSALFSCLNERLIRDKHTIISSNLSIDGLADIYSQRVFSRVIGNYELIKLEGKDIRLTKRYLAERSRNR